MATPESTAAMSERANELVESVAERLHGSANVSSIFGDPIERGEKTVVPVGRVAYGFGGGFGSGGEPGEEGAGSGIGGGVAARPVGVFEITDDDTRFVRASARRRLAIALVAGYVLGRLLGRRK